MNKLILFFLLSIVSVDSLADTSLDLGRFRTYSLEKMKMQVDEPFTEAGVWFQDGVGPTWTEFTVPAECVAPSSDYSTISFMVKIKPFTGRDTYFAVAHGLNGEENLWLAIDYGGDTHVFFSSTSLIAELKNTADLKDVKLLIQSIKKDYPGTQVTHLEAVGYLTLNGIKSVSKLRALHSVLETSKVVQTAHLDGIVYIAPFEFGAKQYVGAGNESKVVWPEALRTVTAPYRKANYLMTAPSLPRPFGAGPRPRKLDKACEH